MATKQQRVSRLSFDGHILRRGFWLYVWRISCDHRVVHYVGRTGDSSSNYASSPFVRIGRHLDLRPQAKSNSLTRRLHEERLDPVCCAFQFVAFGPLFRQQASTAQHRKFRDHTGALETYLANALKRRGYNVIGTHSPHTRSMKAADVAKLEKFINDEFPKIHSCRAM